MSADTVTAADHRSHFIERFRRYDFLWLVLFLAGINAPVFLRTDIWPIMDVGDIFQRMYFFYTNFFFNGELANWFPYGNYGLPSYFMNHAYISPGAYLIGLFGALLRVSDFRAVFLLSFLIEQLILLYGVHLLTRLLFKHRATAFFVSLGIVGSTVWLGHAWWSLRIFYVLPLIFYHMILFFERREPHRFWFSGILFVCGTIGNNLYYVPLQLLLGAIVLFPLAVRKYPAWLTLFSKSGKNYAALLVFLALALAFLSYAPHVYDHLANDSPGRDPETLAVNLDQFLDFGGFTGIDKFMGLIYPGHVFKGFTLYFGIVPLVFMFYALTRIRHPVSLGLSLGLLFLVMFSSTDQFEYVAQAAYYLFPPIRYFRYISHSAGMARLLFLLLAGYGLDLFLERRARTASGMVPDKVFFVVSVLGVLAVAFMTALPETARGYQMYWPAFTAFDLALSALMLVVLNMRVAAVLRSGGLVIVLFYAMELAGYQWAFLYHWPKFQVADRRVWTVQPTHFQMVRSNQIPPGARAEHAERLADFQNVVPAPVYNFLWLDPCLTQYHSFVWDEGVVRLFDAMGSRVNGAVRPFEIPPERTVHFQRVLGCGPGKLRLETAALIVDNEAQAQSVLGAHREEIAFFSVLYGVRPEVRATWTPAITAVDEAGTVRARAFSANRLSADVTVNHAGGVWLYYADAYHPGWRAYVDGERVPIAHANLAFKAVKLEQGTHSVLFSFFNGRLALLSYFFAMLGVLFAGSVVGLALKTAFCPSK